MNTPVPPIDSDTVHNVPAVYIAFYDRTINEGEEFLLYSYPPPDVSVRDKKGAKLAAFSNGISTKMYENRTIMASLSNAIYGFSGQDLTCATIREKSLVSDLAGQDEDMLVIKFTCRELSEELAMAIVVPAYFPDQVVSIVFDNILEYIYVWFGSLRLQDFKKPIPLSSSTSASSSTATATSSSTSSSSSSTPLLGPNTFEESMGKKMNTFFPDFLHKKYDPFFERYIRSVFDGCSSQFGHTKKVESLYYNPFAYLHVLQSISQEWNLQHHVVPWMIPSVDLYLDISQHLSLYLTNELSSTDTTMTISKHNASSSRTSRAASLIRLPQSDNFAIPRGCVLIHRKHVISSDSSPQLSRYAYSLCQFLGLIEGRDMNSPIDVRIHTVHVHENERHKPVRTPSLMICVAVSDHILVTFLSPRPGADPRVYVDPFRELSGKELLAKLETMGIFDKLDVQMECINGMTMDPGSFEESYVPAQHHNAPSQQEWKKKGILKRPVYRSKTTGSTNQLDIPHLQNIGASQTQMSRGPYNALFHFLHISQGNAVMVHSSDSYVGEKDMNIGIQFLKVVSSMRETFALASAQQKEKHSSHHPSSASPSSAASPPHPYLDILRTRHQFVHSVGVVEEIGVKLHSVHLTNRSELKYWVIGRMHTDGSLNFVCYHQSVPQDMIELAFALSHGFSNS